MEMFPIVFVLLVLLGVLLVLNRFKDDLVALNLARLIALAIAIAYLMTR